MHPTDSHEECVILSLFSSMNVIGKVYFYLLAMQQHTYSSLGVPMAFILNAHVTTRRLQKISVCQVGLWRDI